MIHSAREALIYFNKVYHGDWDRIFQAIQRKEEIPDEIDIAQNHQVVTILDATYPIALKNAYKCPLTLYFEGDISLLNNKNIMCVAGCDSGDKRTLKLIKELSDDYIIINGMDSAIEVAALTEVMKNNMPLILVLDDAIDNTDLDEPVFQYAVHHGCVITEFGFDNGDADIGKIMNDKTRIIAWLSNRMLITSSNKKNTRLCLLIDEALSKGSDIFVLPEKPFTNSMNNELIKSGSLLCDRREDIF